MSIGETVERALQHEIERFDGALVVDDHAGAAACLRSRDLTRSIDRARFEDGNLMQGTVLMLDGKRHRERRRIENPLFRLERLIELERSQFPMVIQTTLDALARQEDDLIRIGGLLATVLSARIAGVDFDESDADQRELLIDLLQVFAQGEAIDASAEDPKAVKARVQNALTTFERHFYDNSVRRRNQTSDGPTSTDILGVLLGASQDGAEALSANTVRNEAAFFFEAGAHTSSQSLANTLHYVLDTLESDCDARTAALQGLDRRALQRCVHEAIRLRPTNPLIRRRAVRDTSICGRQIRAGQVVLINTYTANRDTTVYGSDADVYRPQRKLPEGASSYGLSFGAGPHQCIGRTMAIGIPARSGSERDSNVGIVTLMAEALLRRDVRRDPLRPPLQDSASLRWTRWSEYPVLLDLATRET